MKEAQFYGRLAAYYDFICSDRRADVEILLKLISKHKKTDGNRLLDISCGTGLEDKYLKKQFDVTGLDLNDGVLQIARKRNRDVRYLKGDMRTFDLKRKFDVLACFDAMMYLKSKREIQKAIKNFYRHLENGGLLVFYIDGTFLKEHNKEKSKVIIEKKFTKKLSVILFLSYQRRENSVLSRDIFFITENGKSRVEVEPTSKLGLFSVKEIRKAVEKTGFKVYIYATDPATSFSAKKYDPKSSAPVFVCVKDQKASG
jgi:ubiquinone/menaquinone biosynthesis C-methylase UbiE